MLHLFLCIFTNPQEWKKHPRKFIVSYAIELNKSRLGEILTVAKPGVIKKISMHLIQHNLISEGLTFLVLSGHDQNQCAAVLQQVLSSGGLASSDFTM